MVVVGCGLGIAGCDDEPAGLSGGDIATSGFGSSGDSGTDIDDDGNSGEDRPGTLPDVGAEPWCGDGVLDEGEACDGNDFGGRTCEDEGADGGNLRCTDDCRIDACECTWENGGGDCPPDTPPICGNGIQEYGESCDGGDIPSWDFDPCEAELGQGFYGGVSCTADCTLDTSSCGWCGDGIWQESYEECDGDVSTPLICTDVGAIGGAMGCTDHCSLDPTTCEYCGNGVLDPGEDCDQDSFVETECGALSAWATGLLACSDACTYDLSTCDIPGGTLVISEVSPIAVPDPLFPQGEWLELHNPGDEAVSLDSCTLGGLVAFETQPFELGIEIPAGGYATFGHGTPEDLGFTPDHGLPDASSFLNVGDLIWIECAGTLVDEVEYDDAPPWPSYSAGSSIEVSADALDALSNDAPESWCAASTAYAPGYAGTPGGPSNCPADG